MKSLSFIFQIIFIFLLQKEFLLFTNQQILDKQLGYRYFQRRHLSWLENNNNQQDDINAQVDQEAINSNNKQQDESWSHWWSYDGISG